MSSTSLPSDVPQDDGTAINLNYGFILAIGIIFLIVFAVVILAYYCTRSHPRLSLNRLNSATSPPLPSSRRGGGEPEEAGMDEATLSSYPKLLYSNVKRLSKDSTSSSCCSICLADYRDAESLRMLPECGHLFHVKCVDAWLRLHPTCPVCRTSPLPTPSSTPLSENVPLVASRV